MRGQDSDFNPVTSTQSIRIRLPPVGGGAMAFLPTTAASARQLPLLSNSGGGHKLAFRMKRSFSYQWALGSILAGWLASAPSGLAQDLQPISLPPPQMTGGKPLMQALKERQTVRDFSPASLPPQVLSDLLWAGDGINRPEIAHRTAPSAMNSQEIDLYVATTEGIYVYDAKGNRMEAVASGDIRARTGGQDFVKVAPVALILVADLTRLTKAKPEDKARYATIDAGYISQNIYLFCASAGLATVVHETDRTGLREALHLKPDQKIIIAQSVGYPKATPASNGSVR
jgi:nitroreductase